MHEARSTNDLAAALLVSIEAGLLDAAGAIRVVDDEITSHPSPPAWLIAASLAKLPDDLLIHLREGAGDHAMLREAWALLEAMGRALERGRNPMELARKIGRLYPDGEWPPELGQALYDVYEETGCAHNHRGVPQPEFVEAALRTLLELAVGRSVWSGLLERVSK